MSEKQRPGAYFDVDGTIFKSSLLEKVVDQGIEMSIFKEEIFKEAVNLKWRWQDDNNESTYVEYIRALVVGYIASAAGMSVEVSDKLTDQVVAKHSARRFKFPRMLMEELADSHSAIAISGSPEMVVSSFVDDLPFLRVIGSQYETRDGIFTGHATSTPDKAKIREALIAEGVVRTMGDVAIGDTMGDSSILAAVDYPIMFNPSATLRAYGEQFGWPIVTEQKDNIMVLEATYGDTEDDGHTYTLSNTQSLLGNIQSKK